MNKNQNLEGLIKFIEKSPTVFHAVAYVKESLENAGCNYVVRNDSALIAYKMPKYKAKGFRIIASHGDSPCFKIKTKPEIKVDEAYVKLNVEKYGGMILSTWLDRPLGIAVRVVVQEGDAFVSRLVDLKKNVVIPNVAIHFNKDINKGFEYNPQVDMLPLFSGDKEIKLYMILAELLGIEEEEILGTDLYLYTNQKGSTVGMADEFLLAPRLDDLQCAYSTLVGFLESDPNEYISVYCLFDNEEVGSRTRQGADSDFLGGFLKDIWESLNCENGSYVS